MADGTKGPSETVLQETPGRALTFLLAVSKRKDVRAMLQAVGYTPAVHSRAWELLRGVGGFLSESAPAMSPIDPRVADAIDKVDRWDEPNFQIISAALESDFPAQHAFVFEGGLKAAKGAQAVLGVHRMLDQLAALEKSPARKATRKSDHEALAKLATRGITPEERARVAALVEIAQQGVDVSDAPDDAASAPEDAEDAPDEKLLGLWRWYREWSQVAKARIKRRDQLIALGLAERRTGKKKPPSDPPA